MDHVIKEILTSNSHFKIQDIKRKDGLFTFKIFEWQEEYGEEFWSLINHRLSIIDTEDKALTLALEEFKIFSREDI